MIGVLFQFGNDVIEVRVDGTNCFFRSTQYGGSFATIDGLHLDKRGVIKEFPDLKDRDDWKLEAIKRFKRKLKELKTEEERVNYVIDDLKKWGYVPTHIQKKGHRIKKIKDGMATKSI